MKLKQLLVAGAMALLPHDVLGDTTDVSFLRLGLASYGSSREDVLESFPAASMILLCNDRDQLSSDLCDFIPTDLQQFILKQFTEEFKNKNSPVNVSLGLVDPGIVQGYVLVPIVTKESVVSAVEGQDFTYSFRIFADVMLLEFLPGEVQFVASAPYVLNFFDVQDKPYSEQEITQVFLDIYTSNKYGFNFFTELAANAAQNIRPHAGDKSYFQISDVEVSSEVEEILNLSYPSDVWKQQIAQFFSANIVQQSRQPLLPPILSTDLTDRMRIVFSNANVTISMPPASYRMQLSVERFLRHEEPSGSDLIICFVVALRVTTVDGFGDEISNIRYVRLKNSCGETRKNVARADAMYFPESLFSLLSGIASQLDGTIEENFVTEHVKEAGVALAELVDLNALLLGRAGEIK